MKKAVSDRYLSKWWRKAVLALWQNRCVLCGGTGELECHHIIKRNRKVLRWDAQNGVPVCKYGCHQLAHTRAGERKIVRMVDIDYLESREQVTYKDYLMRHALTDSEFRKGSLGALKEIAVL